MVGSLLCSNLPIGYPGRSRIPPAKARANVAVGLYLVSTRRRRRTYIGAEVERAMCRVQQYQVSLIRPTTLHLKVLIRPICTMKAGSDSAAPPLLKLSCPYRHTRSSPSLRASSPRMNSRGPPLPPERPTLPYQAVATLHWPQRQLRHWCLRWLVPLSPDPLHPSLLPQATLPTLDPLLAAVPARAARRTLTPTPTRRRVSRCGFRLCVG